MRQQSTEGKKKNNENGNKTGKKTEESKEQNHQKSSGQVVAVESAESELIPWYDITFGVHLSVCECPYCPALLKKL